MNGGDENKADQRAQLAALRRQLRALETELGAVVDDQTSPSSTDPRTLTARERLLTEAERISKVGSWAWHVETNNVHWSDELFRIMGVDPERPPADPVGAFFAAIHPDDRGRIQARYETLSRTGAFPPDEYRIRRPDGTERLVRGEGSAVLDSLGKPVRFVGTLQDLTELREAERQRLRDHEMLRGAEALAGVGSYRWVPSTGEVIWSAQFKVIVGVAPDAVPSFDSFLNRLQPEDRVRLEASTARALVSGMTESLGVRLVRDDGTVRQLVLEGRFLPGGEMLGSVLDVTEVRRLEGELLQAQKLEALGRLAGGIAHDFNNILAVLKLGVEARASGGGLEAELSAAIEHGAALTRQLLAFGRKNLLAPRPVDVAELLRQSVTLVQRLLGDAVRAQVAPGTEALTVSADPTQLQQTLINLMVNARDAMPSGGTIWLSARGRRFETSPAGIEPPLAPGNYVEIEVRDEGTGIEPAVLPHIFEPFFTTRPEGKGTGLGLASVFGTVSQSGGGLKVRSSAGAGSTFQIYLLRTGAAPAQAPAPGQRVTSRSRRGERILVIDDLPAIRHVLALILEGAGFEPVCVEDLQALVADAGRIAATCQGVVTDLDMPGYSGPEIVRTLWRHVPTLPVLFISGHPALELPSGGAAPTAFLAKPFSADQVLGQLAAVLGEPPALH